MATDPPEKATTATGTILELARLAPASIIRTETVLSKMPIHNLAKKGNINIHITRKGTDGKVELSWRVSPSRDYGEPRQLAYKVDTLIVNRRIDEEGKPLPPMIPLGSIRQICRDLGINEGKGSNDVKRALLQNSSAFISAKLTYKGNDGAIRRLDANFTRYSVIFTGEKLPDGRTSDGVYLILNDPYREVLNNAPIRPLNYDYLRKLPPTQQRFYEIVSYRIFAALKFSHSEAKMAYSEYCTYSAQQRYFDYNRFKKQMYKVHRPHLASGYLKSIRYQETADSEGNMDWFMFYVPGPKARAEYHAFSNAGRLSEAVVEAGGESEDESRPRLGTAKRRERVPRQQTLRFAPSPDNAPADPVLLAMTKRGISEAKARVLLAVARPELVLDQLEWGDHQINSQGTIRNPAGFYIHLIEQKITPPESFLTTRRAKALEEARQAQDRERMLRYEREEACRAENNAAVDRHIAAHILPEDMARLVAQQETELRKDRVFKNVLPQTIKEKALSNVRMAIALELHLPTLEEYCARLDRAGESPSPATHPGAGE
jgi:hypothetical protein